MYNSIIHHLYIVLMFTTPSQVLFHHHPSPAIPSSTCPHPVSLWQSLLLSVCLPILKPMRPGFCSCFPLKWFPLEPPMTSLLSIHHSFLSPHHTQPLFGICLLWLYQSWNAHCFWIGLPLTSVIIPSLVLSHGSSSFPCCLHVHILQGIVLGPFLPLYSLTGQNHPRAWA